MAGTSRRPASAVSRPGPILAVSILALSILSVAFSPAAGARVAGGGGGHGATTTTLTACTPAGAPVPTRQGRLLGVVAPVSASPGACGGAATGTARLSPALTPDISSDGGPPTTVSSTTVSSTTTTGRPAGRASARSARDYSGSPPILPHSGLVMGAPGAPGDVTVTPIFWDPASTMSASYKSVIEGYVTNVAADAGKRTNVFSVDEQYGAAYDVHAGTPLVVTDPITDGCTPDGGAIYSDDSGYSTCVTDAQIRTELDTVLGAHGLPSGLGHAYALFLPKGVESCFDSRDNDEGGECTVSSQGGAFCAYHSSTAGEAIYADLPFPIYSSLTGFTCGSEDTFGTNESPNGQLDADVELSLVAHELNESITDPLGTSWYDRHGNEIADDCEGFYGATLGVSGALYNQVINGAHYLTQEMFSNEDYHASKNSACVQHADLPIASFKVTPRSPRAGHSVRFNARKSKGTIVTFSWTFGDASMGSGRTTSHVFRSAGTYGVTLKVTDSAGVADSTTQDVTIS
ncbi:MAG TPA: PKD domain-containing protein [Acidimicrobiales bacterium]|nr:PKD domain-containing protein [Acidimicrobiales bacterium]